MQSDSLLSSVWVNDPGLHDLCQLKLEVFEYLQKSELGTVRFDEGNQEVVTSLKDSLIMFPRNIIKRGSFQQLFKLSLYYNSHYLINKIREERPEQYMARVIPDRVIDVTIYYFILPERFRTSEWKQKIYNHLSAKLQTPVQILDDKIDFKNLKQVLKDNEITEIIKVPGLINRNEDRQPANVYNFNMLSSSKLNDILEVFYDLMPKPYNLSENEINMVNRDSEIIFIASPYPRDSIDNDPYHPYTTEYRTRAFFKNIPPDMVSINIKKPKALVMSMLLNRQYVTPNIIASMLDISLDDAKRIILLSERESFPGSVEDVNAFMQSINLEESNDVRTNKAKVFLFRLPQLLELTRKIHQDPTSRDIKAELEKPMDPTGKWFPGTIYDAMESPMDAGFVKEIKIEIASRGSKYNDLIAYDSNYGEYSYRERGIEVILDNYGNKWVKNPFPQFNFTGDVRTMASSINQAEVTTYGSLVRLFYLLTKQPASIDDMLEAVFSHKGEDNERVKQYHTQAGYRLMSEVGKYSDIIKIYFDSYPNTKEKEIAKKLNMDDLVKNAKEGTWIVRYIVKSDNEDVAVGSSYIEALLGPLPPGS